MARAEKGFTYVEIIFTVAIIAIMASVVMPYVDLNVTRKKEEALRHDLREIRRAIDAYKQAADEGMVTVAVGDSGYPPSLSALVNGVSNIKDPDKKAIYFLRRLPRDPMNDDMSLSPEQTWGKRSYDSPPDAPREGKDVFDIYSLSHEAGLNGIPYNEW